MRNAEYTHTHVYILCSVFFFLIEHKQMKACWLQRDINKNLPLHGLLILIVGKKWEKKWIVLGLDLLPLFPTPNPANTPWHELGSEKEEASGSLGNWSIKSDRRRVPLHINGWWPSYPHGPPVKALRTISRCSCTYLPNKYWTQLMVTSVIPF